MTTRLWRRALVALCIAPVAIAATAAPSDAAPPPTPGAAPSAQQVDGDPPVLGTQAEDTIADRYIVVMEKAARPGTLRSAQAQARSQGATIHHRYANALTGFAATLPARALDGLRNNPNVEFIEADRTVTLADTQTPATWGIDRIDQRNLPLDDSYTYDADGTGVTAYVIDTGVRFSHDEFGGRAVSGYDAVDGGSADDCNGHGTHVAGTVGGSTYGVAQDVTLVGVRVLNCQGSGTLSGVIAGIDWVTGDHGSGEPAVANMSLGGGASSSIDTAVSNSIDDGVTYAIAAGNSNADACNYSPARVTAAVTVGSTTSSDARSSFSNYGTCLDIFAPGSSITSAWHTSNGATNTISGTSMATPHVAGAAALVLDETPSASPSAVRDTLVGSATSGVLSGIGSGSPDRLLYTAGGGTTPPPPPPPPSECGDLPEVYTGSLSGTGDNDLHPGGTYFATSGGTITGCLDGPDGVDFDLYLYRWNGWWWSQVASSTSSGPDEDVTYDGSSGYYVFEVESYSGSGSYTFGMDRP